MKKGLSLVQRRKLDAAFMRVYREDANRSQKGACAYCREPITLKATTADHIKPRHDGGLDKAKNIAGACRPCNALKGHMPVKRFRRLIENPPPGSPIRVLLAWSRLRINRRLEQMEKRLARATGRR